MINWIKKLLRITSKDDNALIQNVSIPSFRLDKMYSEMNRRDRREYRRWLHKHNMWDGRVVLENLERSNNFHYGC